MLYQIFKITTNLHTVSVCYNMLTAKFGGTAVTPNNLQYVKRIVGDKHQAVVVSAVGKEYPDDVKTTDLLADYYSGNTDAWAKIADKYVRLVERNSINVDVEELLFSAKIRAVQYDLAYCLSLGEELSAKIVARFLSADYIEAQDVIVFNSKLNSAETQSRLKNAFDGCKLGVIGGFYGGAVNGRKTFSRGGSDVTGAIVAAALNSSLYENWTDVYGVCVANPTAVSDVATIATMSYDEMRLLSLGGAEVLHPDAVLPVQKLAIPIKIGNYFNPDGTSTIVCNCPSQNRLLSIAEKRQGESYVTTILHNCRYAQISSVFSEFFTSNDVTCNFFNRSVDVCKTQVTSVNFEPHKAQIITDKSVVNQLYKLFVKLEVD